jgi:alpha-ketoglutarate-dependent taurine dioxygenase
MLWTGQIDHDNPAKSCAELVEAWQLPENRVFVLRAQTAIPDVQQFYTEHFSDLGTAVALAEDVTVGDRDNQRTGEVWMEVRYDPGFTDAYRHSANAQPLHTDGSYIPDFPNATLMACVANAGEGGETTFISAEDVVAALASEKPELLDYLSSKPILHSRSGDERLEKIVDTTSTIPQMNWNYYCLSRNNSVEEAQATQDYFDFLQASPEIAKRTLPVKLAPGDAITWKDRQVLHGRNGFVAHAASERFLWKCAIDIGRFAP